MAEKIEVTSEQIAEKVEKLWKDHPEIKARTLRSLYVRYDDEVTTYIDQKNLERQNPNRSVEFVKIDGHLALAIDAIFKDVETREKTGTDNEQTRAPQRESPSIQKTRQEIVRRIMHSKTDFRNPAKIEELCRALHDAGIPLTRRRGDKWTPNEPKTWLDYISMSKSSKEFKRVFDPQKGLLVRRDLYIPKSN